MFAVLAQRLLNCIFIENADAIHRNVVCRNGHFIAVGSHRKIDRFIFLRNFRKMEIRIFYGGIFISAALFSEVAADKIYDSVLGNFAADHRFGPRIRMIVTGKYDIDTGFFRRRGNIAVKCLAAPSRIGIIRRLMQSQHFPGAIRFCCVLYQPGAGLLQIGRIVDNRHINIIVFHRIIQLIGQGPQRFRSGSGNVSVIFMVTHHLNDGNIGIVGNEYIENFIPLIQRAAVIHEVARLNPESRILSVYLRGDGVHQRNLFGIRLRRTAQLRVADNEEIGIPFIGIARNKSHNFRPMFPVADSITILRPGLQSRKRHAVDICSVTRGRKGIEQRLAFLAEIKLSVRFIGTRLGIFRDRGALRGQRIGYPGNILRFRSAGSRIQLYIHRLAACIAASRQCTDRQFERISVPVFVHRIDLRRRTGRKGCKVICSQNSVLVGNAQLRTVCKEQLYAGNRSPRIVDDRNIAAVSACDHIIRR